MTTTSNQDFILKLENKIQAMKSDGKYLAQFLNMFGSVSRLHLKSDDLLSKMDIFLTQKGF